MAKEEKPLPYERRILDTKSRAQRLDLNYLGRGHWLRANRRWLALAAPVIAALAVLPFVLGWRGGQKAFASGPVSRAHAVFEKQCTNCHVVSFQQVRDKDCLKCHEGTSHHNQQTHEPRCAECHVEHRGNRMLAEVPDFNCTACHSDLQHRGSPAPKHLQKTALEIHKFAPGAHPSFSAQARSDGRPLKLNHAVHLPAQSKTIRGTKLPMKCDDCHQLAPRQSNFSMLPVTFAQHCASCHAREMEFDVFGVLGPHAPPAPHTKDPRTIRDYVYQAYRKALVTDPELWRRPLPKDVQPPATSPEGWIQIVAGRSTAYLFDRKCAYCHEIAGKAGEFPVIRPVNRISGQYVTARWEGTPWLQNAEFSHRVHRMLECGSCHPRAKMSSKTSDVLIPTMESCLACHGSSGTSTDNCSQCHTYHDRSGEMERQRRAALNSADEVKNGTGYAQQ